MTRLSNFIKEKKDENKDVEVTEMISENRWKFTDFLKEDGKSYDNSKHTIVDTKQGISWNVKNSVEEIKVSL